MQLRASRVERVQMIVLADLRLIAFVNVNYCGATLSPPVMLLLCHHTHCKLEWYAVIFSENILYAGQR